MRKNLIVLILLFSLSILIFNNVLAQAPYFPIQAPMFRVVKASWGTVNSEIDATPGDMHIPLTVTIQNIGNLTVTGLSMKLMLQHPFTNISYGRIAKSFYEGNIQPGSTATISFILNIDKNATIGEYTLKMIIDYLAIVTGVGKTLYISNTCEVDVPIFIAGKHYLTIYSITTSPRVIPPGGNFTLSGTVVNIASTTFNNVNISVFSPILTRSSTAVFIGQVDPNIPRPFSLSLQVQRKLPNGTFPITIYVVYQDSSLGVTHINSVTTPIHVQQIEVVKPIVPSEKKSFIDVIIDVFLKLLKFFFGFPALIA
ncbi:MAG: hypothetical protein QXF83_03685 [Candidatus Bathyarchaeia archaeon]